MEIQYCQNGGCLAEAIQTRGVNNWPLCSTCAAAYDVGDANADMGDEVLLAHLKEQAEHYRAEIMPLYPSDNEPDSVLTDFSDYDEAKNEFLESLWDVIQEHFVGTA